MTDEARMADDGCTQEPTDKPKTGPQPGWPDAHWTWEVTICNTYTEKCETHTGTGNRLWVVKDDIIHEMQMFESCDDWFDVVYDDPEESDDE